MRVLMVTPHLPPHQAANALLPHLLGEQLREDGHDVSFLTFGDAPSTPFVAYVKRRGPKLRSTRVPQAVEAFETWRKARTRIDAADVVHVHSNTWMNQVAARLAHRAGKPYILTHYGTEIWHHDGKDPLFRHLNAAAAHVAFYSAALLERGRELGVPMRAASVVYPPVADVFRPLDPQAREQARRRFLPEGGTLLVNVKRLHPLADHETLIAAMVKVRERRGDAVLLIAGAGEAEAALKAQADHARLRSAVRFLGLVPNADVAALQGAADLFVLSSVLEATPTVALEALATGTPVVSTDNPGGVELATIFGDDVTVVPRRDPEALAAAVLRSIESQRRAAPRSLALIEERFRLPGVASRYLDLYREARGA